MLIVCGTLFDNYSLRMNYERMCVEKIKTNECAEPKEFDSICLMTVRMLKSVDILYFT